MKHLFRHLAYEGQRHAGYFGFRGACTCDATEIVGPHPDSEHDRNDCGYARWGRTDMACGGCLGCIAVQVAYYAERERMAVAS